MVFIIGLHESENGLSRSIEGLEEAGLSRDKIRIITQENVIQKCFNNQHKGVVSAYAISGAAIGIAIYGIFGLLAGLCQCNLLNFGRAYGIITFLGGILAGAFVGGVLGCLVGISVFEKDTRFYIERARVGGKLIMIQTDQDDIEMVKRVLEQEKTLRVKVLQHPGTDALFRQTASEKPNELRIQSGKGV